MRSFARLSIIFLFAVFSIIVSSNTWAAGPKVAVLPWKVNSAGGMEYIKNAMSDMLSARLGSGEVELIRPDLVKAAVNEKMELTEASAAELGKKLKADYVLFGSVTIFGSAVSMDSKLVNAQTGVATPFASNSNGIESVIGLTDTLSKNVLSFLNPKKEAAAVVAKSVEPVKAAPMPLPAPVPAKDEKAVDDGFIVKAAPEKERPVSWKSRQMDGVFVGMAAADLNKDGVKELFLISEHSVIVAEYDKENGLKTIKEFKDSASNIAITAIDADKDGRPEVYVSRVSDNKASSEIIEYKDNSYAVTAKNIPWLLKTVAIDKTEPVLIGQKFRSVDGLYGELKILKKQGAALVENGAVDFGLPSKVNLYRFDAFNFTDSGGLDLVTLDSRDYLTVYTKKSKGDGWTEVYKSKDFYGGTLNYIKFSTDRPGATEPTPIPVEGKFLHAYNNGKPELIICKNTPGGLGRSAETPVSFKTGEIISLSWDKTGETTAENWRTKQIEGYVSDFILDDLDGDGNREATMLVVAGTDRLFQGQKSYVLSHRISLK